MNETPENPAEPEEPGGPAPAPEVTHTDDGLTKSDDESDENSEEQS